MEKLAQPLDLLVVAAHPDDAEISVGGTMLRFRKDGGRVGVLDLTNGEPTPNGTPEKRAAEATQAAKVLGLDFRDNLGLPNRSLQHTLEARGQLAGVFRQTQPKIILAPYWDDVHPDHVVASELIDAARFWARLSQCDLAGEPFWPPYIFYYWSIHLRIHPQPAFVLDISEEIEVKMQAVRCYESQMVTGRSTEFPTMLDDIRDRARYWGWTIHSAFGEPFASREEVGLNRFPTRDQASRSR